jgi:hypothetical protein
MMDLQERKRSLSQYRWSVRFGTLMRPGEKTTHKMTRGEERFNKKSHHLQDILSS